MMRPRMIVVAFLVSFALGCAGTNSSRRFDPHIRLFSWTTPDSKSDASIVDNSSASEVRTSEVRPAEERVVDPAVARPQAPPQTPSQAPPQASPQAPPVSIQAPPLVTADGSTSLRSANLSLPTIPQVPPAGTATPAGPATPLHAPTPVPAAQSAPGVASGVSAGTPPAGTPPAGTPPAGSTPLSWPAIYGDEHRRETPTVRGELLNLNPAENGVEKAVELARRNEQLQAEIKALQSRIAGMEQMAKAREDAVAESLREVETATVEVIRSRAELQAARKAVASLKDQLKQVEQDDLETLKAIVAALEKVLSMPKE